MRVEIVVTKYVFKYLLKTYGPSPYPIDMATRNDLRVAFSYMAMIAEPVVSQNPVGLKTITLDLGDNPTLIQQYKRLLPLATTGLYFHHEFKQAMRVYVEAQIRLKEKAGLTRTEWNYEKALEDFLHYYDITDDDYNLESASRQLRRLVRFPQEVEYNRQKMYLKSGFCTQLNQPYKLARIIRQGPGFRIVFNAFSISQEKVVRKQIRVPFDQIYQDRVQEWADPRIAMINDYLIQGYCVA